jgi:hypothetical protein
MVHHVKNLSSGDRLAVESLLDRSVSNDEWVEIRAVGDPACIPSSLTDKERESVIEKLNRYFAEVEANRLLVSKEEEDEIINEALRSTRPNYRPIR